jgi:hypothetical protein
MGLRDCKDAENTDQQFCELEDAGLMTIIDNEKIIYEIELPRIASPG